MKVKTLIGAADALGRRESYLRARFLEPIITIKAWTPAAVDFAAAYTGLLHSEAEYTLERVVHLLLENAHAKSMNYRPDPVLVNCCAFYREKMHSQLGKVMVVPERKLLATDAADLLNAWDTLGGRQYFEMLINDNHGAGVRYVERLLHPLGIVVNQKTFGRYESAGVQEICKLGPEITTMLTEFVVLRGSAVHAGTAAFADMISAKSPPTIGNGGRGVVEFVDGITRSLARVAW